MVKPVFTLGADPAALKLREEVFILEQGYDYDKDDYDDRCWSLTLYLDETCVATGRLIEEDPETYRIGRVAVKKELRHKKVGSYAMKFLMAKARELGARKAVVHAQVDKTPFYRQLGFKEVDGEIFLEDGTPHVTMVRSIVSKRRYGKR